MTNDAWGLSFGYDGFGNLTQQTRVQGATAPSMSVTVNPATNRITTAGYGYDANGNVMQTPDGRTYSYDVANWMVSNGSTYNPKTNGPIPPSFRRSAECRQIRHQPGRVQGG
jgi:hypothetical protein